MEILCGGVKVVERICGERGKRRDIYKSSKA
jgi:hypothetical protein